MNTRYTQIRLPKAVRDAIRPRLAGAPWSQYLPWASAVAECAERWARGEATDAELRALVSQRPRGFETMRRDVSA